MMVTASYKIDQFAVSSVCFSTMELHAEDIEYSGGTHMGARTGERITE